MAVHVLCDFPGGEGVEEILRTTASLGVRIGTVNPNLFQDQVYKHRSLANPDPQIRERAIQHVLDSVELARQTSSRDITVWRWNVTAIRPHKQILHLTLSAILRMDGSDTEQMLTTFEKEIEVEVALFQHFGKFYDNNWQWLWGTILLPIIIWIWKLRKSKKSS